MTGPAAWVDITAGDAARSRTFYGELFAWPIEVVPELDYGLVEPGPTRLPGGIGQSTEGGPHPRGIVIYFTVDDVDESVRRAEGLGGEVVVPSWGIPGMGTMAVLLDPEGNRFGVWAPPAAS